MITKNIYDAKTNLSKLIQIVDEGGEEVVICRAGKPIVTMTRFQPKPKKRKMGAWKGKMKMSADFQETPSEITDSFYTPLS